MLFIHSIMWCIISSKKLCQIHKQKNRTTDQWLRKEPVSLFSQTLQMSSQYQKLSLMILPLQHYSEWRASELSAELHCPIQDKYIHFWLHNVQTRLVRDLQEGTTFEENGARGVAKISEDYLKTSHFSKHKISALSWTLATFHFFVKQTVKSRENRGEKNFIYIAMPHPRKRPKQQE